MNKYNEPEVDVVVRVDDEDKMVYLSVPKSLERWAHLEAVMSVGEQALNHWSWRSVLRFPRGWQREENEEAHATRAAIEGHLAWLKAREEIASIEKKSGAFLDSARTAREDLQERLRGTKWFRIQESIEKSKERMSQCQHTGQ